MNGLWQDRDVVKAIKKRLGSKSPNSELFSVHLLEMLINNIGEPVHKQVIDTGILPILVKIVKKKSDLPIREKIFLLLDAAQTSLGGASGRFPQYYSAHYELVIVKKYFSKRASILCSILQKASTALEVLREVLDAVDSQHPEGAKDEFTLDLVEQCSFQKQRVIHLAISSR
ncbi:hypothetical protein RND71_025179 [Anisodus tanguticus]|uniref:VHS domain-containing protein n=1 Tax=Anisodus tanguticus TaxID=243964 RepID=A0AAE1RSJ7_9SOLA|nr:hypothetical protein RND71_025179 [Anisodus tanguticus]